MQPRARRLARVAAAFALTLAGGCASFEAVGPEASAPAEKARMAANVASVTLEEVPLGVPVGLRLPGGGYYALRNESSATLRAVVAPMSPTYCERTPGAPLYSPVTNLERIAVEPREFTIPPHSEAEAMVVVTLPDDEALRGAHLEFWLRAHALAGGMGSVALYSRVRLDVAAAAPSDLLLEAPRPARSGKIQDKQPDDKSR